MGSVEGAKNMSTQDRWVLKRGGCIKSECAPSFRIPLLYIVYGVELFVDFVDLVCYKNKVPMLYRCCSKDV